MNRQKKESGRAKAASTSLPEGFAVSERVRSWAIEKGFGDFVDAHFEHMVGTVKASGKKYVNWDEALMNYIRGDYGDVRRKAALDRTRAPSADLGDLFRRGAA